MRVMLYIIQKEFLQIFRNKAILPILFLLPVFQMLILVYAASFEMKEIKLHVIDRDNSSLSRELIASLSGSPFINIVLVEHSSSDAEALIFRGHARAALIIPPDFERDFYSFRSGETQLLIDAINGTAAELTYGYIRSIFYTFNQNIILKFMNVSDLPGSPITIESKFWYNPELDYKFYMAPGILVILVTIIGIFLGGINLVREREIGTIEQINVTPIRKYQFIAGKLIPFWLIGLVDLLIGLAVAKLAFDIPIRGNIMVLLLFASVFLMLVLSIGLFFSSISSTQQQVALLSFFFLLVFILMSGLFTPLESMPEWAHTLNLLNPLAYFVKVMRNVILKGSGVMDLARELISMLMLGLLMLSLAVYSYRKRS
jgi:ABC-2 type transport system permease protein